MRTADTHEGPFLSEETFKSSGWFQEISEEYFGSDLEMGSRSLSELLNERPQ